MKKIWFITVAIIVMVSLLSGCSSTVSVSITDPVSETNGQSESYLQETNDPDVGKTDTIIQPEETEVVSTDIPPVEDGIDSILQQMTIREKIGQLFIIRADSLDISQTSEQVNDSSEAGVIALSEVMADMIREYPVGGIVMFGKNIVDSEQLTSFVESLQSTSNIPLFMAIDEEGGLVARLANHSAFDLPKYASAAAVGASEDSSDALAMGTAIGAYLDEYGFNMDFAPVADVNTNPTNPVIGSRAFSSNAVVAAEMAKAMAEGLKQQNIIPVFKHFPGHGDTAEDSHSGIAISYKTKDEMASCEWIPYESLTDGDCVMIGHIATPNITGDLTPATMSDEIINDILRQQLGFDGVVITDSLAMGAITNEYNSGQAAIEVIKAGCDILLGPEDFREAFEAVIDAVENGVISEERINESVYRILLLKEKYGLLN